MREIPYLRGLKDRLKGAFPSAAARYLRWKEATQRAASRGRHLEEVFSRIYAGNLWGDAESVSGSGSNLHETRAVREQLPSLLRQLGVTSMIDAPCGDCYWLGSIELGLVRYVGVDIVPELIARNRRRLARPGVDFKVRDISRDSLPAADLILCRDCLIHFSFHYIRRTLRNFQRSGAAYLLTTTYSGLDGNHDILSGQWRPLDLELPPFGLPRPLQTICEKEYECDGLRLRRNLGLWRLGDLADAGG
jgi:hypothetical protein